MTPERNVYLLDPQRLKPEVIAVAFAKTSRSPQTFRQIAAELTDEKSAEFHEKWVVGYGHSSVAEHAVLHIAVENLSRLAVESLESNRLASYTEKSTRYQKWGPDDFTVPPELVGHPLLPDYLETCRSLFKTYHQTLPAVQAVIAAHTPRNEGETERAYENRIRSDYIDVCRFLLPAASLANVGMTINARALEHAIQKMLSHPLEEVRQAGMDIRQVGQDEVPTLLKYAEAVPYLQKARAELFDQAGALEATRPDPSSWCRLLAFDPEGEDRLLASALFSQSESAYAQLLERVRRLSWDQRLALARTLLGRLGKFDIPVRELEHSAYTFELVIDQGAYFEFKRHRIMSQTVQPLTARLGYATPRAIVEAGMEATYRQAMRQAQETYEKIASFNPDVAAYVVPNAFNRRILFTSNLRSLEHLVQLRSAPNAHFSIRRAAHRIAGEIRRVTPLLGAFLRESKDESWQDVESRYFASTGLE